VPGLGGAGALLRVENFADSVAYRIARLRDRLAAFGPTAVLEEPLSQAAWRAVRDVEPLAEVAGAAVWRLSLRPSRGPGVAAEVARACGALWFLDWAGGLVWIAGPAEERVHARVVAAVAAAGGTWTLVRAPLALRQAVAVIPPEPEPLARISGRVKAAFDPAGILNPGRMRAGS
jgi:glycolate oxidase FAD binding subunit